jgi:hypothetical protein
VAAGEEDATKDSKQANFAKKFKQIFLAQSEASGARLRANGA